LSRLAAKTGPRVRHRIEYTAVRSLITVVRFMPGWLVRACGTALGIAFYTLDGGHRRIAHRNLATAFPARSARERRDIARQAFGHFGRLLFELLRFATLTPARMLASVDVEGEERSRLAYAQGKGVLFVTGHFGYWELQAMVHALQGEPVSILARALGTPYLNQWLEDIRQRTANTVIYRRETIRRVMRTLQAGRGVAVLVDPHNITPAAVLGCS